MQEFREVAKLYPTIKAEEMIVDNTCMQLAGKPHQFDVMVRPASPAWPGLSTDSWPVHPVHAT